jgi:CDP-diacylglycerol--glycerol-3-phosphate 3-phosphatidyltransferase
VASIYDLKPAFQGLLRPLTRGLAALGVTANQVTLAATLLSFAVGGVVAWQREETWPLLLLPATLFVRMALNAVDGMLAREHNMKTPLGGILNELGDVFSDAALYLPVGLRPEIPFWLVTIIVILSVISEMTGVLGLQTGAGRRYEGPMGKSDRAFVFGVLGLVLGLGWQPGWPVTAVLVAVVVLLGLTILNRAHKALKKAVN